MHPGKFCSSLHFVVTFEIHNGIDYLLLMIHWKMCSLSLSCPSFPCRGGLVGTCEELFCVSLPLLLSGLFLLLRSLPGSCDRESRTSEIANRRL